MALIFLQPSDLSATQAQQVLDVLNQATSAEQLADRIELPGEPDIGVKLAGRLLRARTELGGQFSTLVQVDQVPQIGPERFTDLCVAILGLGREQFIGLPQVAQLQQRLTLLEQSGVGATPSSVVLQVEIEPQPAWVGQTLDVVVQVSDAQGEPLANRLLTIEGSVGQLHHSFGYAQQEGPVVQVRSGADGCVRLQWQDPTDEPLTVDQRNALELTLSGMDASALTPQILRGRFNQLAAEYDDERNIHLRHALDIYSRQGQKYLERLNTGNAPFEWPLRSGVLRVYLHAAGSTQGVDASAVLMASWKDWVPAWFSFLHDWMSQQAALPSAFGRAKTPGVQGRELVDKVLSSAHSFVASQKGFAAQLIGQHVVGDAVNRFLSTGIDDLSDEIKQELFPSLEIASEQIRAGNRGSLSLVSETRAILTKDISRMGGINTGMLDEIKGIQQAMNARALAIDAKVSSFNTQVQQFNTQYSTFTQNYTTFTANYGVFTTNYTSFNTDRVAVNKSINAFQVDYAKFNQDKGLVGGQITQFNTDFSTFQTQRVQISSDVAVLKTDVAGLNTKLIDVTRGGGVINRPVP